CLDIARSFVTWIVNLHVQNGNMMLGDELVDQQSLLNGKTATSEKKCDLFRVVQVCVGE
ncbi:hypothetical protein HHI36_018525, partial [Cryptolaemus montrouzieri]